MVHLVWANVFLLTICDETNHFQRLSGPKALNFVQINYINHNISYNEKNDQLILLLLKDIKIIKNSEICYCIQRFMYNCHILLLSSLIIIGIFLYNLLICIKLYKYCF